MKLIQEWINFHRHLIKRPVDSCFVLKSSKGVVTQRIIIIKKKVIEIRSKNWSTICTNIINIL